MSREIEIIIDAQGGVSIELIGYQGQECEREELLAALQGLLDDPDEVKKPEFYQSTEQQAFQR